MMINGWMMNDGGGEGRCNRDFFYNAIRQTMLKSFYMRKHVIGTPVKVTHTRTHPRKSLTDWPKTGVTFRKKYVGAKTRTRGPRFSLSS